MKIAVSSDWHGKLPSRKDQEEILNCDLLLLAGDTFDNVLGWERRIVDPVTKFLAKLWEAGVRVCAVPGNHEFHFYNGWLKSHPNFEREMGVTPRFRMLAKLPGYTPEFSKEFNGIEIFVDELLDVSGKKIYFTPWTPEFYGWAFMLPEEKLSEMFSRIPEGLDLLICHGPPRFGQIDTISGNPLEQCGSTSLLDAILEKKPKRFFCGHIHTGSHDEVTIGETLCQNVSLLDESYEVKYPVKVLEI